MICPTCDRNNLPGADWCVNCLADLTHLDRPVAFDRVHNSLLSDPVAVLSPKPALTVSASATVGTALELMAQHDIGAVVVLDDAASVVGIFSERDLLMKVALETQEYRTWAVADLMTRRPVSVQIDDPLAFVLHHMDCGGYRHLPVFQEGVLVGMVSVRDMLRHITEMCRKAV